jgi:hypothetical protein
MAEPNVNAAAFPWLRRRRQGRLIRCTVPGFTPKRFAMTRTPGLPGLARALRIRFSSAGAAHPSRDLFGGSRSPARRVMAVAWRSV